MKDFNYHSSWGSSISWNNSRELIQSLEAEYQALGTLFDAAPHASDLLKYQVRGTIHDIFVELSGLIALQNEETLPKNAIHNTLSHISRLAPDFQKSLEQFAKKDAKLATQVSTFMNKISLLVDEIIKKKRGDLSDIIPIHAHEDDTYEDIKDTWKHENISNTSSEIVQYRQELLSIIPKLEEIGLVYEDGKYFFHALQWPPVWPNVWKKHLTSFPNHHFLKKNIAKEGGAPYLHSIRQLKKLFVFFGLEIADEADEIKLFRKQLEDIIPDLKKIGLLHYDKKYFFHNMQWVPNWPKIGKKVLYNFPYRKFLQDHKVIKQHQDNMKGTQHLQTLFEVLGFEVANESDEMELFKKQLEEIIPKLKRIGLEEKDGILYFDRLKNWQMWPKIHHQHLRSFPSTPFNQRFGIGRKTGEVNSRKHLASLFQFFGFSVKLPE